MNKSIQKFSHFFLFYHPLPLRPSFNINLFAWIWQLTFWWRNGGEETLLFFGSLHHRPRPSKNPFGNYYFIISRLTFAGRWFWESMISGTNFTWKKKKKLIKMQVLDFSKISGWIRLTKLIFVPDSEGLVEWKWNQIILN